MAIVKYVPSTPQRAADDSAQHRAALVMQTATRRYRTLWGQRRNTARLEIANAAMKAAEAIAMAAIRVEVAAKNCAAEVARLDTDIAAYGVQQRALELEEKEIELALEALPERLRDEASLAKLRRDVERAKLEAEKRAVDGLNTFTHPVADRASDPPSLTPNLDAERAAAARKQHEALARWIVEDVQAGHVPAGSETPYHAFAACVFASAQLEGLSVTDAAARARHVLLDRIVSPHPMFAGDPAAYRQQYDDLKKRLDARTGTRQTATVLSAMHKLGAAASANGNGGGVQ
ncbi:MAG TPA: hypothetical protein VFO89_05465 [Thermoanaerobaculia bacterium]|nr:hypothetical protein [Thermoanaerobaculia bacterium]